MGGAIKKIISVVVTAVIASFSPFAGFIVAAVTSLAAPAAIVGAFAGAALVAVASKALRSGKTKQEEVQPIATYATTSLKNDANNNNVVPILYGNVRSGGNRPWWDLVTGSNPDLYSVIVIANHELNAIKEVLSDSALMTQGTGGDTDNWRFTSDKVLVKAFAKNRQAGLRFERLRVFPRRQLGTKLT